MGRSERSYFGSSVVPFRLVFIMWLSFSVQFFYGYDLTFLGILPRTFSGLLGVATAPMVHGDLAHLISNTVPLIFLGATLYFFYERIAGNVFFRCYFYTNLAVWALSPRVSYHIGASGLIYGLAFFLIFFGFWRRDFRSIMISLVVLLTYGGIFYGLLPTDPRVSWESHLAGALVGMVAAFSFAHKKKVS